MPPRKRSNTDRAAESIADQLSYAEAQTALELALARLQDPDLPVEAMAELYQRARSYVQRCETILQQVEQSVQLWDPQNPDQDPLTYEP